MLLRSTVRRDGDEVNEPLQCAWYRLDLTGLPRGVVAVDATPSAAALWFGPVASILEEIAEKLPAEMHPEVAFLGDRKTYPLASVLRGLAMPGTVKPGPAFDVASQLGRYPVLGPLLWELSHGPARPLLVLANATILDAEDWAVPVFAERTLVYRMMGADAVSHPAFNEVGPEADLGVLVDHLRDSITAIRIGHPVALAMDWSNDACRWTDGVLHGTANELLDLTAQFLHPANVPPEVVVMKASGAEHHLKPSLAASPETAAAIPLTPAEGNVLNLWRRGSGFWCGRCSRTHAPGKLWCAGTANVPGLFPSLDGAKALAVQVAVCGGEWTAMPVPRGVAAISENAVSVTRAGTSAEYHFDGERWLAVEGEPSGFLALDGDCFLARCGAKG